MPDLMEKNVTRVTRGLLQLCVALTMGAAVMWAGASTARAADAWGCDYDKCVAYCTKVSGKQCSTYCQRRLQEKRAEKVCK